ncbi:alpha/beta hydrolase [Pseudorhodoplanes sp.]|uniref:alpha/beta hydrolase n=1 Tax=Pseudorhodoplanes sp. TaxID=1934341 RepID=UPI002D08B4CE|nr:alpha/beta hydrolase [Pseudorhodoplanes sp.]HWV42330.1 alpha/beta hydrolase [Pseudorhodoplanes sp.]
MAIDNSAAYNNRAAVADFPNIVAQWQRDAAAYREKMAREGRAELDVRFGPSERQYMDLFTSKDPDAPVALFIHGGYWRAMSPKEHSHLAQGLTGNGVTVAVAGYDLTPQVSIAQIIEQMREATLFLWKRYGKRIMVYGHSAGGHLAACMLATDWEKHGAPADLVPAAYAISGVFDLAGLINTDMNVDFKLDETSARESSPLFWPAPKGRILDVVVGGAELPEFIRLSHVMADSWGAAGVETRYEAVPGMHHFNVVAPLADPLSAMTRRVVELSELTR